MGRRVLKISDSLFVQMFGVGQEVHYRVIEDGLPRDAKAIGCEMDVVAVEEVDLREGTIRWVPSCRSVVFVLESQEWEPSPEGSAYPVILPVLERLYPREEYLTFSGQLSS